MTNGQVGFVGQTIFFEKISSAGESRRVLARAALALADKGSEFPLQFAEILGSLSWNDFNTLLAMLSLRSNRVLHWNEDELQLLRQWAF